MGRGGVRVGVCGDRGGSGTKRGGEGEASSGEGGVGPRTRSQGGLGRELLALRLGWSGDGCGRRGGVVDLALALGRVGGGVGRLAAGEGLGLVGVVVAA